MRVQGTGVGRRKLQKGWRERGLWEQGGKGLGVGGWEQKRRSLQRTRAGLGRLDPSALSPHRAPSQRLGLSRLHLHRRPRRASHLQERRHPSPLILAAPSQSGRVAPCLPRQRFLLLPPPNPPPRSCHRRKIINHSSEKLFPERLHDLNKFLFKARREPHLPLRVLPGGRGSAVAGGWGPTGALGAALGGGGPPNPRGLL